MRVPGLRPSPGAWISYFCEKLQQLLEAFFQVVTKCRHDASLAAAQVALDVEAAALATGAPCFLKTCVQDCNMKAWLFHLGSGSLTQWYFLFVRKVVGLPSVLLQFVHTLAWNKGRGPPLRAKYWLGCNFSSFLEYAIKCCKWSTSLAKL